jgi:hypothetical protein
MTSADTMSPIATSSPSAAAAAGQTMGKPRFSTQEIMSLEHEYSA